MEKSIYFISVVLSYFSVADDAQQSAASNSHYLSPRSLSAASTLVSSVPEEDRTGAPVMGTVGEP